MPTTRFYFPSSGAAAISPTFSAVWEMTASADRIRCVTSKADPTAMTTKTFEEPAVTGQDTLARQYVSDPLLYALTFTTADRIKGQIRALSNNAAADAYPQTLVRVVTPDGVTRGILESHFVGIPGAEEFDATTLTNRKFPKGWVYPGSGSAVDGTVRAQAGDRIVFEFGARNYGAINAADLFSLRFGTAAAGDLAEGDLTETETLSGGEGGYGEEGYGEEGYGGATVTENAPWMDVVLVDDGRVLDFGAVAPGNRVVLPPRLHIDIEPFLDATDSAAIESWRRISPLVRSVEIRRGRQDELGRTETGVCTVEADNSDRRFEPGFVGVVYNLLTNPSFENDSVGYVAVGSVLTRDSADGVAGYDYLRIDPNNAAVGEGVQILGNAGARVPVTPGLPYVFSTHLRGDGAGTWHLRIEQYSSGGALLATTDSTAITPGNGVWARYALALPAAHATAATVALYILKTTNHNSYVSLDGLQFQQATVPATGIVPAYLDGDRDNAHWEGTRHASRSFLGGPYPNLRLMQRLRVVAQYGNNVADGSFEERDVPAAGFQTKDDYWYHTNGAGIVMTRPSTGAFSGTRCLKFVRASGTDGIAIATNISYVGIGRQWIPVAEGDLPILSVYAKRDAGAIAVTFSGAVFYIDQTGQTLPSGITQFSVQDLTTTWARYDNLFANGLANQVPAGAAYAQIAINMGGASGAITAYLDAIQLDFLNGQLSPYQATGGVKTRFRGNIERISHTSPSSRRGLVRLDAVDSMAALAASDYIASPPSEGSNARIARVLDNAANLDDRILDAGTATLAADTLDTKHLTHIQDVAVTELGLFFIDGEGRPVFHDKNHRSTAARSVNSQFTFGDGAGELPILRSILLEQDVQRVINQAKATSSAAVPVEQTANDATSQARYRIRSRSYQTLHSTDAAALTFAQAIRDAYKEPPVTIRTLEIDPVRTLALSIAALHLELSDRILANRRSQGLAVRAFPSFVESISEKYELSEARFAWRFSVSLSPAP